jgi:hypothetical protein
MMEAACAEAGLRLVHLIGPETGHGLHPETLAEMESRLANIAVKGRVRTPRQVRFVTHTLRYDRMHWVRVDRMMQHWEAATVEANWELPHRIEVQASGVEALSLVFAAGDCPLDIAKVPEVTIDGVVLEAPQVFTDRSWEVSFSKAGTDGTWKVASEKGGEKTGLAKRHGLQGPIDDAFMDSFLMVSPTGKALNEKVAKWSASEMDRAVSHWRLQFRGHARLKKDIEVTDEDIANHNLILWGDPGSNRILKRIGDELPIRWDGEKIRAGDQEFSAIDHALAMIYPNPLNPERYIVLNSGFTYREYDYLNNARQTPKLPDWAIIDLKAPVTTRRPGGIPEAGFFGERWEYLAPPRR